MTTYEYRRAHNLCQSCGTAPPLPYYARCRLCHEKRREDASMRRFDRRVELDEPMREQGLVTASEKAGIMGVTLRGLEGRVRRGSVRPVVRGRKNWYEE